LGSHLRALPGGASIFVQARSSQAEATSSHQSWLALNSCRGQVAQAGVFGGADPVFAAGAEPVDPLSLLVEIARFRSRAQALLDS